MFRIELEKMMTNTVFYFAIFAILMILLAGNIYTSPLTGKEYTVFNVIFASEKSNIKSEICINSFDIIIDGIDSYMDMFLPIIAASPFVVLICNEKKNSNIRFEIYRVGKEKYVIEKYLSAMMVGGLVTVIGYAMFCFIIFITFQGRVSEVFNYKKEFIFNNDVIAEHMYHLIGISGIYLLKFIKMFFYGAVVVIPAFCMTMVTKNKYLVLSVPFIMDYFLQILIESIDNVNYKYFLPQVVGNIYMTDYLKQTVIYGGKIILGLILCRVCVAKKCDCGEG